MSDSTYFETMRWLVKRWKLRDRQYRKLLNTSNRTFYSSREERPHFSADQRDRISHLVNIELMLGRIFDDQPLAPDWLRRSNEAFEGRTPLDIMTEDGFAGILRIRTYLERLQ